MVLLIGMRLGVPSLVAEAEIDSLRDRSSDGSILIWAVPIKIA